MTDWTLGDFFDMMEKNGYKKATNGEFINYKYDPYGEKTTEIATACAVGQAALNMGMSADDTGALAIAVETIVKHFFSVVSIYVENDGTDISVPEIARKYRNRVPSELLSKPLNIRLLAL